MSVTSSRWARACRRTFATASRTIRYTSVSNASGVAGHVHVRLDLEPELVVCVLDQVADGRRQAVRLEQRRAQLEHQPAGALEASASVSRARWRGLGGRLVLAALAGQALAVEREQCGGQHLDGVVVQLLGDPRPLVGLGAQHLVQHHPPLLLGVEQRGAQLLALAQPAEAERDAHGDREQHQHREHHRDRVGGVDQVERLQGHRDQCEDGGEPDDRPGGGRVRLRPTGTIAAVAISAAASGTSVWRHPPGRPATAAVAW